MKYILLLAFTLMPMANAESWIRLDIPEGFLRHIDRDSIKTEGDFTYYTMKDYSPGYYYSIIEFKHDCKYSARRALSSSSYDTKTNKFRHSNIFSNSEMIQYRRTARMIKVEKIVCRT